MQPASRSQITPIGRKLHKNIKSENQKSETRGGRKERRGCAESSLTNSTVAELEAGEGSGLGGCSGARLNLACLGRLLVEIERYRRAARIHSQAQKEKKTECVSDLQRAATRSREKERAEGVVAVVIDATAIGSGTMISCSQQPADRLITTV